MTSTKQSLRAVAVVVLFLSAGGFCNAQEAGLEPLQQAWGLGFQQVQFYHGNQTQAAMRAAASFEAAVFTALDSSNYPAPDPATLAWLAGRIPGLDTSLVRIVPPATVDSVMLQAAQAKLTYMDVLSEEAFRQQKLFYVPQDTLNQVDRKYISGLIAVSGHAEDGNPFQMQGFVAGKGRVELLYDRDDFSFKESGGHRFKVTNGGRVSAAIQGAGDITLEGLSAYGAPIFCPWAKIQRMTKESMYKVRVQTSCGTRGGNDVDPIRLR